MKKLLIAWAMLGLCHTIHAQTINKLEYFIDTDKGIGKNKLITVTAAADGSFPFPFTAALSGLSSGSHILYVRAKDSKGNWSLTARQTVQVLPVSSKEIITAGEYFFDTDEGFGQCKKITVAPQDSIIMQSFTATVNALQPGYHKLYIRFLDNYGNWSQTSRYNVQVARSAGTQYIVEAEYFFIKDAGVGNCASVALTPLANGSFSFTIPADQIPANAKKVYVRVRDSSNNDWSLTRFKTLPVDTVSSSLIADDVSIDKSSIVISPNPAHSFFTISFKGFNSKIGTNAFITSMEIRDIAGRVLLKQNNIVNNQKVNISSLSKGIYLVTLYYPAGLYTQKLVVE